MWIIVLMGGLLSGCSLMDKKSRPDPAAENVFCTLEYRPLAAAAAGDDLLFLAWSSPYREESFNLSLPDVVLHRLAAPGRHLIQDARVEGATCSSRTWRKGFRLPTIPSSKKWILCRRQNLEPVLFEVETKWGVCRQRIPAGDRTPREIEGLRRAKKLPKLGDDDGLSE